MFGMMIDTGPKIYVHPSTLPKGPGERLRIFMLKFYNISFCKPFDGFDSYLA